MVRFSLINGAALNACAYASQTATTTSPLASLCSWTCTQGTTCVTTCGNDLFYLSESDGGTAPTWLPGGGIWNVVRPGTIHVASPAIIHRASDQELYERAVAEHDTQEAERIQRRIAERERVQQEREAQYREDQARRAAAIKVAHDLLLEHLTEAQRKTFAKNGWFVVEGGRSKTQYRIRSGSIAGNIDVMSGKRATHRLCCHAPDHVMPHGDHLLAQKMMLEYAEDDFLKIANRTAA